MTLKEYFLNFKSVLLPPNKQPVYQTTIDEINNQLSTLLTAGPDSAGLELLILEDAENGEQLKSRLNAPKDKEWAYLKFGANGNQIIVSQPHLLFSTTSYLLEYQADIDIAEYAAGKFIETAFKWQRPAFDSVLTQSERFARNVDFRKTIREYAKMGYSHVEVNCPATPHGMEPGVPNEVYTVFYAYGAGLDQFVSSRLNRGIYPAEYLSANLGRMKR
ncbi:hypothetical protein KAH55_13350, partial [bacterium]|nr:hypothetical protein [bacterium]